MIVYCITNCLTNKVYVGQTVQGLHKRWLQHCRLDGNRKVHSAISLAIKKYGKENFKIEVLSTYNSINELNEAEIFFIKKLKSLAPNGYNFDSGGKNKRMHSDTKLKLSIAKTGKKVKPYNHVSWNKGKKGVQKYKTGKDHAQYGIPVRPPRIIFCLTNDTFYSSIKIASAKLDLDTSCITKVCRNKRKQVCGYIFRYIEDLNAIIS